MTPLSILSATLNAAAHETAIGRLQKDLTLLAAKGFSPSRTGNLAIELRDIAQQYVAALDTVIVACEVEAAPNIVRLPSRSSIRAVPVVGVAG